MMKYGILITLAILYFVCPDAAFSQSMQQLGSSYYAYPVKEGYSSDSLPQNLRPFYISHYGRHGSRWLTEDQRYAAILEPFATMELTPLGEQTYDKLKALAANGIGRSGNLTPLGERQHHDIAQRMMARCPEVFADSAIIRAQSSTAMRCAMSMAAFCEGLKELNPKLQITRQPYQEGMVRMAYVTPESKAFLDSLEHSRGYLEFVAATVDPSRIVSSLFVDPSKMTLEQQLRWLTELYWGVQSTQNVGLESLDLYSIFTHDEMEALWRTINARHYMCHSDSPIAAGRGIHCADSLLRSIIAQADEAIASQEPNSPSKHRVSADLRFGHDTHLLRLLALTQLIPTPQIADYADVASQWRDYTFSPMAANLQLIFLADDSAIERNGSATAADAIYVVPLLNEQPLSSPQPWPKLRAAWLARLD